MHRPLSLTLLALLFVVGISMGWLRRERQRSLAGKALIAAVKREDAAAALAALNAGADPNVRNYVAEASLFSRMQGRTWWENLLHLPLKSEQENAWPVLLLYPYVTKSDDPALVNALLDAGAKPNLTGGTDGASPLMFAADKRHPQSLSLMIRRGGDLRQRDMRGLTALHYAVRFGSIRDVAILLDAGADGNAPDNDKLTPLHWAARVRNLEAVRMLLQHHSDPNLCDRGGKASLDWSDDRDAEIRNALWQAGAKPGGGLGAPPTNGASTHWNAWSDR